MKRFLLAVTFILLATTLAKSQTIQFAETTITGVPNPDLGNPNVSFADVNGDGNLDILLIGEIKDSGGINSVGYTKLLIGDGAGNFSEDTNSNLKQVFYGDASFADIDKDGDLDMVLTGDYYDPILVGRYGYTGLYQNNNGVFTELLKSPDDFPGLGSSRVEFTDINNDTFLDFLVTGQNSEQSETFVYLYLNDNSEGNIVNTFTMSIDMDLPGYMYATIDFVDITDDGNIDLVISGFAGQGINDAAFDIFTGDGTGEFTEINSSFDGIVAGDVSVLDFDGDGDLDIMYSGYGLDNGLISRLYLNNQGAFTKDENFNVSGILYGGLLVDDFNGDNKYDFVINGTGPDFEYGLYGVYQGNGDATFTQVSGVIDLTLSWGESVLVDIDNDGANEIFMIGFIDSADDGAGENSVRLFENVSDQEDNTLASEYEPFKDVSVYPNPSNGRFEINLNDNFENLNIRVIDFQGKTVYSNAYQNTQKVNIDLDVTPGIYMVNLSSDKKNATYKMIVE